MLERHELFSSYYHCKYLSVAAIDITPILLSSY